MMFKVWVKMRNVRRMGKEKHACKQGQSIFHIRFLLTDMSLYAMLNSFHYSGFRNSIFSRIKQLQQYYKTFIHFWIYITTNNTNKTAKNSAKRKNQKWMNKGLSVNGFTSTFYIDFCKKYLTHKMYEFINLSL